MTLDAMLPDPVPAENLPTASRAIAASLIACGDAYTSGFCTFAAFTTTSPHLQALIPEN